MRGKAGEETVDLHVGTIPGAFATFQSKARETLS